MARSRSLTPMLVTLIGDAKLSGEATALLLRYITEADRSGRLWYKPSSAEEHALAEELKASEMLVFRHRDGNTAIVLEFWWAMGGFQSSEKTLINLKGFKHGLGPDILEKDWMDVGSISLCIREDITLIQEDNYLATNSRIDVKGPEDRSSEFSMPLRNKTLPDVDGVFLENDGSVWFEVSEELLVQWQRSYPMVDVLFEVGSACQWARDAEKSKRKTAAGAKRFFGNWLRRAQKDAVRNHKPADGPVVLPPMTSSGEAAMLIPARESESDPKKDLDIAKVDGIMAGLVRKAKENK